MVILGLASVVERGSQCILIYYLFNSPLCMEYLLIGYFLGIIMLVHKVAGVACVKLLQAHIGDTGMMIVGTLSAVFYNLVLAVSTNIKSIFIGKSVKCQEGFFFNIKNAGVQHFRNPM